MIVAEPAGVATQVDANDAFLLDEWRWSLTRQGGYLEGRRGGRLNPERAYLHRLIMGVSDRGVIVDHVNGNVLDNRRANLRITDAQGNQANRHARTSRTGFKGVALQARRYFAQIKVDGQTHYLGRFDTPEEAARAYDVAAREMFGEFANTNFPDVEEFRQ